MFTKSATLALLAVIATVSAQAPAPLDHISFTNPVGDSQVLNAGQNTTFSWTMACKAPGSYTAADPTKAQVQLLNSTDSNNAYFLREVVLIDCSKDSGNQQWTVPTDLENVNPTDMFSLQILTTPKPAYSGKFKIVSKSAPGPAPAPGPSGDKGKSAASTIAPVLSGAAVLASAALLLL